MVPPQLEQEAFVENLVAMVAAGCPHRLNKIVDVRRSLVTFGPA